VAKRAIQEIQKSLIASPPLEWGRDSSLLDDFGARFVPENKDDDRKMGDRKIKDEGQTNEPLRPCTR
jgi:hypothetical protein